MKKIEINIGDEFITKNKDDAFGGHILTIIKLLKSKNSRIPMDDTFTMTYQNITYTEKGSLRMKKYSDFAKRWWLEDFCIKINRGK